MGRGSWDDPRARATRGLRRIRGSRQTVLLARRAPTIKRWSLDARSEEQSAYSLWGSWGNQKALARANGTSRRASGWAGENIARSWDHPSHPLKRDSLLRPCVQRRASLGEEAVLAASGWVGGVTAGVGWVRRLVFLSILRSRILPA